MKSFFFKALTFPAMILHFVAWNLFMGRQYGEIEWWEARRDVEVDFTKRGWL